MGCIKVGIITDIQYVDNLLNTPPLLGEPELRMGEKGHNIITTKE